MTATVSAKRRRESDALSQERNPKNNAHRSPRSQPEKDAQSQERVPAGCSGEGEPRTCVQTEGRCQHPGLRPLHRGRDKETVSLCKAL